MADAQPDENAAQRATRRAARAPAQEVEGTEEGRPVVVEVDKDSPPQKIEGHEGGEPVEVKFAEDGDKPPPRRAHLVSRGSDQVLAPDTTEEADRVTEGQRRVNLIWESVQGIISVGITSAVIYCQINAIQSETLNNAFFFVVATYLQRSNHVRIGGTGQKANESVSVYRGR